VIRQYWLKEVSSDAVECNVDAKPSVTQRTASQRGIWLLITQPTRSNPSKARGLAVDSNQPRFQTLPELQYGSPKRRLVILDPCLFAKTTVEGPIVVSDRAAG
jgi:hypothetical protein